MNSVLVLSLIATFFCPIDMSDEVVIKSFLSQDESALYVDLSLPIDADVSFTLAKDTGELQHHWENQTLSQGRHQIALHLPLIAQGKYQLLINVNDQQYQQLVYKSR